MIRTPELEAEREQSFELVDMYLETFPDLPQDLLDDVQDQVDVGQPEMAVTDILGYFIENGIKIPNGLSRATEYVAESPVTAEYSYIGSEFLQMGA